MESRLQNVRRIGLLLVTAGVVILIWGLAVDGDDTTALPWAAAYAAAGVVIMLVVRYLGFVPANAAAAGGEGRRRCGRHRDRGGVRLVNTPRSRPLRSGRGRHRWCIGADVPHA